MIPADSPANGGVSSLVAQAPAVPLRELFRRFWPYARRYRGRLLLALIFVALVPATDAATIWVYKLAVDHVLVPQDMSALLWVAGLYVGFTSLNALVTFADMYLSAWVGGRFLVDVRSSVFRHLETLSLDFFERSKLGDLLARLTGDVSSIETLAVSGIADALSYALRIVLFSGALFFLDWRLALAALITGPLFWLTTRRFSRRIKQASRERRRRSGALSAVAEESLGNVALVQAYNRQATEAERLDDQAEAGFRAGMTSTRLRATFSVVVDGIEMAGALLVMGLGTWELSRGSLTLGGLVAFLAYLSQLYSPIRRLSRLTNTLFSASASAERIAELLDAQPTVRERAEPRRLRRVRGFVAFERVSFAYPGTPKDALDGVSFGLAPGETLALVGASGAGKSTAAKLLLRFYDPTSGCVRLDGHDARELSLEELRRHVTLLLQETLIFDGTIAENIRYGRADATGRDVERAARAADAHEFIEALPDGYETVVGQRGRRLSGGQRQRLAIARAMVRDAPVLVLDEPTTGLDAESGHRILAPMRRLMEGRTTLVISHNLVTVRDVDRIVVLHHGRVVERGTHDSLLAAGGRYARLWRLHQAPARPRDNVVPLPGIAAR